MAQLSSSLFGGAFSFLKFPREVGVMQPEEGFNRRRTRWLVHGGRATVPLGAEARQLPCLFAVPRVTTSDRSHIEQQCVFGEAIDNNYIWSGLL